MWRPYMEEGIGGAAMFRGLACVNCNRSALSRKQQACWPHSGVCGCEFCTVPPHEGMAVCCAVQILASL